MGRKRKKKRNWGSCEVFASDHLLNKFSWYLGLYLQTIGNK